MDNLNKPDEKRLEGESTEHLSEERLDQVSGVVPKGQNTQQYMTYTMTEVVISSVQTSGGK